MIIIARDRTVHLVPYSSQTLVVKPKLDKILNFERCILQPLQVVLLIVQTWSTSILTIASFVFFTPDVPGSCFTDNSYFATVNISHQKMLDKKLF